MKLINELLHLREGENFYDDNTDLSVRRSWAFLNGSAHVDKASLEKKLQIYGLKLEAYYEGGYRDQEHGFDTLVVRGKETALRKFFADTFNFDPHQHEINDIIDGATKETWAEHCAKMDQHFMNGLKDD